MSARWTRSSQQGHWMKRETLMPPSPPPPGAEEVGVSVVGAADERFICHCPCFSEDDGVEDDGAAAPLAPPPLAGIWFDDGQRWLDDGVVRLSSTSKALGLQMVSSEIGRLPLDMAREAFSHLTVSNGFS